MNEQATVASGPLALAGTDLEVQLGDAHVIERVVRVSRTLVDMRAGGIVGRIIREGDRLTVHRARHRVRPPQTPNFPSIEIARIAHWGA